MKKITLTAGFIYGDSADYEITIPENAKWVKDEYPSSRGLCKGCVNYSTIVKKSDWKNIPNELMIYAFDFGDVWVIDITNVKPNDYIESKLVDSFEEIEEEYEMLKDTVTIVEITDGAMSYIHEIHKVLSMKNPRICKFTVLNLYEIRGEHLCCAINLIDHVDLHDIRVKSFRKTIKFRIVSGRFGAKIWQYAVNDTLKECNLMHDKCLTGKIAWHVKVFDEMKDFDFLQKDLFTEDNVVKLVNATLNFDKQFKKPE